MGRCEAFAKHNSAINSFFDGLGAATGYTLVLLAVSILRELFGFGTLLGVQIIPNIFYSDPAHLSRFVNFNIMALAPSAFFILGIFIGLFNWKNRGKQ